MTSIVLAPSNPKPGASYTITYSGFYDGHRRDVTTRVDDVEISRFQVSSSVPVVRTLKAPAVVGPHQVGAYSMIGCASATLVVESVVVTPPPVPPSGIPVIQAGWGALYRKNFADGTLGEFRLLTYPNQHEANADLMLGYKVYGDPAAGRYLTQEYVTDAAHTSVHDGYLDQVVTYDATRKVWLASFVGTFDMGTNNFTKSFTPPFRVRACIDFGGVATKADWRTFWVYGAWKNKDLEVPDFPEIIGSKVTANLHSPGKQQIASLPVPAGWAIYESIVTPTDVTVALGAFTSSKTAWPVGTGPLGLYVDAKVGLDYPDANTGSPRIKTAWITVDPA